ncbi:MAG: TatD family hydrolase [Desulfobacteraceae bacterium]|nr:TatD family hydrolase [Desulfobacteraceae bacterium]
MNLIDAHCHLQDSRIIADQDQIIKHANAAGIEYMVCCATCEKDWYDVRGLSLKHDSIIPVYGIHPWFVDNLSLNWKKNLVGLLESETVRVKNSFTPGIGEAGLDFAIKGFDRSLQEKIFTEQLMLAKELKLPISIHIRKAWDLFIHLIKKIGKLPTKGLIHSYSGSSDMIPLFEKYGFYISFSGSITRPGAKKVIKALKAVSENRMLIETDSPDILPSMLPKKKNTQVNRPENLVFIADIASQIKKIPVKEYTRKTYNNGVRLFNISKK